MSVNKQKLEKKSFKLTKKKIFAIGFIAIAISVAVYISLPPLLEEKAWTAIHRIGTDEMYIQWQSASPGGTYLYRVYTSYEDNINTVEDMEANGTAISDWIGNTNTFKIVNVSGYYFNIMVKNVWGYKSAYHTFVHAGAFEDVSELIRWMDQNMTQNEKMVTIDLEEKNQQEMGKMGLALMQTNESASATVLKNMNASYVMVNFGFLYPGLNGNEGQWSQIMDACNDNTLYYESLGLSGVEISFDKETYMNSTSGLYKAKWFESTLVKLMMYHEPTIMSNAKSQTEYYYAARIQGSTEYSINAAMTDNGNYWRDYIPIDGNYPLTNFELVYRTNNGLFKVYRVL